MPETSLHMLDKKHESA